MPVAQRPKGLFGYTDGMARDILEDLKRTYYDEVDGLQDSMAGVLRGGLPHPPAFQGD